MTLQQFRYIVAIADTSSFAQAALAVGVTQPTLSAMVRKLEQELGANLFDRSTKPVIVTEIGEVVINRARRVLAEAESISQAIAEAQNSLSGPLRLGILPTIAPYLLPLFLRTFVKTYPKLELVIHELKTDEIATRLLDGRLDIGILATPHEKVQGLDIQSLFEESFYAYAKTPTSKKYLLAEDIDPDELWVLEEGHCFGDQVLDLCALSRSSHSLQYVSGSIDTLKRLVEAQGGVTVLPELALRSLSKRELKLTRPFAPPTPKRTVSLISRRNFVRTHVIEVLAKAVKDAVAE
jgi:LysR family hydrogen peroxide-inducible transcriptional activator